MVYINTDFTEEQDHKIELVKAIKRLPTKQDSIKVMVDLYDVNPDLKKEVKDE